MKGKEIYSVIFRSLNGTWSENDKKVLEHWLSISAHNQIIYDKLSSHWKKAPKEIDFSILNQDEVRERTWHKLTITNQAQQHFFLKVSLSMVKYAAAILILCTFGAIILFNWPSNKETNHVGELINKSNVAGRKSTIYLSDGSVVFLNSESEINYNPLFTDSTRIVWLKGEAFFQVAPNAEKPFLVYTNNLIVQAIGTEFNVNAFDQNPNTRISLSEGKVSVRKEKGDSPAVILNEGEQVGFSHATGTFGNITQYDRVEVEGWRNGVLYFNKSNIYEIEKKISAWYGVQVHIKNAAGLDISYSGQFDNQNLENVLTSMGFVLNFEFEIDARSVKLNFK
ncbi:MAG: DUF4974 domain-containing protein [Cyclobacteriaceae bacterium]|nr:DUF4974 domain-containing protein [Cyclobacteriaceae bacterium]